MSEKVNFLQSDVMSLKGLFCPTNSPKTKKLKLKMPSHMAQISDCLRTNSYQKHISALRNNLLKLSVFSLVLLVFAKQLRGRQ